MFFAVLVSLPLIGPLLAQSANSGPTRRLSSSARFGSIAFRIARRMLTMREPPGAGARPRAWRRSTRPCRGPHARRPRAAAPRRRPSAPCWPACALARAHAASPGSEPRVYVPSPSCTPSVATPRAPPRRHRGRRGVEREGACCACASSRSRRAGASTLHPTAYSRSVRVATHVAWLTQPSAVCRTRPPRAFLAVNSS